MFSRKWEFIFMQAEAQSKVTRNCPGVSGTGEATKDVLQEVGVHLHAGRGTVKGNQELSRGGRNCAHG